MAEHEWDAVVVGAGIIGAIIAQQLTAQCKRVLLLEAGRGMGLSYKDPNAFNDPRAYEVYRSYVEFYHEQLIKIPNSPYPPNPSAPSPYATDNTVTSLETPDLKGYWVQNGRYPFMSSYLRQEGGTTLHWMGSSMRMLPADFELTTRYGLGKDEDINYDWPLKYQDLQKYYRMAEWEIGVAANRKDQEFGGITFEDGYDYPMEALPNSWLDQVVAKRTKGLKVTIGSETKETKEIELRNLPAARNSIPRDGYTPQGAVGAPHIGQRCEGNSSCTPICPVQAKYSALKTLAKLDTQRCTIQPQTVATTLELDENGRVKLLNYKRYDAEGAGFTEGSVRARIYVLAAHAVENAKILLASRIRNGSDQLGRNLMDHPYFMTWGLAAENLGVFRGPGYTSGIPAFRDGKFRKELAAFRLDVGNWGWNFSAMAPFSDVTSLLDQGVFGRELRNTLGRTVPHQFRLGFQIEQLPRERNRVTISEAYKDAMGNHRPVITYDVDDYTWNAMVEGIRISARIFDRLKVPPDQRFHLDNPSIPTFKQIDSVSLAFYGAGHLAGTHKMGTSSSDSVVDVNQRSHDHDNLYVVGCGSLPTIATSNPTLTAAALAFKSAEAMQKRLS